MLTGVIPALPTFFTPDYSYDAEAMHRHIDRLLTKGVQGIFILSGIGEFLHLKTGERRDIAADIVKRVRGHVKNPGVLDAADLADYAPKQREPICSDWKTVWSSTSSACGGERREAAVPIYLGARGFTSGPDRGPARVPESAEQASLTRGLPRS